MTQSNPTEISVTDEEPPSSGSAIEIDLIIDHGVNNPLSKKLVCEAARLAAASRGFSDGSIGVRITNDATIRELNATHLGHDYATDVISFGYTAETPTIEGELVVSVDTAAREAKSASALADHEWTVEHELMLYVVHGVLHITGMDDHDATDRIEMRAAEEAVFLKLGIPAITRCGADKAPTTDGNEDDSNDGDPS